MNRNTSLLVAVTAALLPLSALAVMRDPESVESIRFDYANYRNHDIIGGTIRAETPVYRTDSLWAFTAELGAGRLSQDIGPNYTRVGGELGLKLHATPVTDMYAATGYERFYGSPDYDAISIKVGLRQYLLPPDSPILPYVRANGILQFIDPVRESPARQSKDYRLTIVELLGGLEVHTEKTLRWVFEGGRSQSKAINNAGPDLADGWIIRIAMIYEWF